VGTNNGGIDASSSKLSFIGSVGVNGGQGNSDCIYGSCSDHNTYGVSGSGWQGPGNGEVRRERGAQVLAQSAQSSTLPQPAYANYASIHRRLETFGIQSTTSHWTSPTPPTWVLGCQDQLGKERRCPPRQTKKSQKN